MARHVALLFMALRAAFCVFDPLLYVFISSVQPQTVQVLSVII